MGPLMGAAVAAGRGVLRRGGQVGKRVPELVRGTTLDDLMTAKKRAEQIVTGGGAGDNEREDGAAAADQGPKSRRRLAPLSLCAKEPHPEAAHGPLDADALPLGLLCRVVFGKLPSTAASTRAWEDVAAEMRRVYFVLLPSAAASSLSWEDVAAEVLARFACGPILPDLQPRRRKLSAQDIIPAYQGTSCRLILLGCDGAAIITNGLRGFVNTNPTEDWRQVLTELCADANNTVFLVSGQRKADVAQWSAPCQSLGISAEKGYFTRWTRDSPWLCKRNGTTMETLAKGLRDQGRITDFILCIADDECVDMINNLCAPSTDSLFPGAAAEVFACSVGDKPTMAKYYLEDHIETVMMLRGLVDSLFPGAAEV